MGTFNVMSERLMDHLEEIADTKTPAIMHVSRFMDLCAHSVFVYVVDPLVVLVSVA